MASTTDVETLAIVTVDSSLRIETACALPGLSETWVKLLLPGNSLLPLIEQVEREGVPTSKESVISALSEFGTWTGVLAAGNSTSGSGAQSAILSIYRTTSDAKEPSEEPRLVATVSPRPSQEEPRVQVARALELNRSIIEASTIVILAYEAGGQCIFSNRAAAQSVGTDVEGMLRQNFRELKSWRDSGLFLAAEQVLNDGVPVEREFFLRTTFGKDVWFSAHLARFYHHGAAHVLLAMHDISDRKRALDQLVTSLQEKDVLLREIHHRIKNNLQVVSSLLHIQSCAATDLTARAILEESQSRIRSMSLVHEKLYRSESLAVIDFDGYATSLAAHLLASYRRGEIEANIHPGGVQLDVDTAVPCGLIVNELITNCLKHAFVCRGAGVIDVSLQQVPPGDSRGTLVLAVKDNGVGLPPTLDLQQADSIGMRLVHALARQLNGVVESRSDAGTTINVYFKPLCTGTFASAGAVS